MRILLNIIFLLLVVICSAQKSSSTSEDTETNRVFKPLSSFFMGSGGTYAGDSSPKRNRSANLLLGVSFRMDDKNSKNLTIGLNLGKAFPNTSYKGITIGTFLKYNFKLVPPSFRTQFIIPIELGYKKLINDQDEGNINQFNVASGISVLIPSNALGPLYITVLGDYKYDSNSIDIFKGFYPTVRLDFYL